MAADKKPAANKSRFDWQPWARLQALGAAFFILTGGVIGIFYPDKIFGIINTGVGAAILLMEYPVTPLDRLGFVSRNLWIRVFLYLAAAAGTTFQAPATTGGFCMVCAALTYARAAINGEIFAPLPKPAKPAKK
ncbi:hypothetical protein HK104_001347 [Borealophlyctis nickersoniae]|nr:hypothetical protein HK104_001347 [Borealophlyctis nickersoniae]